MRRWSWLSVVLSLGLGLTACADPDPATAVVVSVKTDLTLTSMVVRTYPGDADLSRVYNSPSSELTVSAADLSRPVVINKGKRDDMLVVVRGFAALGATQPLVEHAVRVSFASQKTIALPVFLGKACEGKVCAAGQTCYAESHAGQCAGGCAAVALADVTFEIEDEGAEASWQPRTCPNDGGMDRGDGGDGGDAGDSGLREGGPDPVPTPDACVKNAASDPCGLSPNCGCPSNLGCRSIDSTNASAPVLSCEPVGTKGAFEVCASPSECRAGSTCIGGDLGAVCKPFCDTAAECGTNGACTPVRNASSQNILGVSVCNQKCTTDANCSTGCCIGAGQPDAFCALKAYCDGAAPTVPEPTMCIQDGKLGCTADSDCCSAGTLKGRCVKGKNQTDGGLISPVCVLTCTTGSQCASGCCVPLIDNKSGCFPRSSLSASEIPLYCAAQ